MRYFYDCEFIEDGCTITLISIGIVAEDGRELYMQSSQFSPQLASDWVKENVLPHLVLCPHRRYRGEPTLFGDHIDHFDRGQCTFSDPEKGTIGAYADCAWRTREQIKREILAFMDISKYGKPELWAWYAAYDHVAFCQLFGTMMDLPPGFPMFTNDLKQCCATLGDPRLSEQGEGQHNALADARWNKQAWDFLSSYMPPRIGEV